MIKLTMEDASTILDTLWSSDDPIYYRGKETNITSLANEFPDKIANHTTIKFYGSNGRSLKRKQGRVTAMILDRLGLRRYR